MSVEIALGIAGDMVHGAVDPYTTKVGGSPAWMGDLQKGCPTCRLCSGPLSLVLQCYAPLAPEACGRTVTHRALHLFGCAADSCRNKPGSWRAFRSQAPEPEAQSGPGPAEAAKPAADTDWGLEGADDWGAADGGAAGAGGGALDVSDLAKELEALDSRKQEAEKAAEQQRREAARQLQEQRAAASAAAAARAIPAHVALPEFYIVADAEPAPDEAVPTDRAGKRALELLQEYQSRQQEPAGTGGGTGAPGGEGAEGAAGDDADGAEAWGNEQYEAVTVRGVEKAHYKFLKRIQLYPEQCARYGFGADPLFPSARRPEPSPCDRCGAQRVFEVQLLPPLLHYLDEAFDMEKGAQSAASRRKGLRRQVGDWDWTAVFVYSCGKSCTKGSGDGAANAEAEVVEEEVWVDSAEENLADIQRMGSPIPPVASSA